jgi:hypothetical protein
MLISGPAGPAIDDLYDRGLCNRRLKIEVINSLLWGICGRVYDESMTINGVVHDRSRIRDTQTKITQRR